jgi:hypothetical protein
MATNLGTAVNFGFTGTNGITGLATGQLLQSVDHTRQADVEDIRDADGDVAARVFYNPNDALTLEVIVTGTGLAAAITNTTLQTAGTIISITACASAPDLVATNWVVESARLAGSNVDAKRITLQLKKNASVTAAASA